MIKPSVAIIMTVCLVGCTTSTKGPLTLEEAAKEECKNIAEIGSIVPKRICHNKATWAELDKQAEEEGKELMRKAQARGVGMPPREGFGG